ncbi:MAG: RDD family protein [Verrucomicrobiota bacterium]
MSKKEEIKLRPWLKRPSWISRLAATSMDFGICGSPFLIFRIHWSFDTLQTIMISSVLMAGYYYLFESTLGRTPGKTLLRMRMMDTNGQKPSKVRIAMRIALRFGMIFMMLSWRRVTLLDLISGCRVEKMDISPSLKKKIEGKPKEKEKTIVMGWR